MNKELINKLIERARAARDNSYCPFTNNAIGCSLLTGENMIFGGCNIENKVFSCSAGAGEVAVLKAVSEGYTSFKAICFYSEGMMPFPDGAVCQVIAEFSPMINIIVANEQTYSLHTLYELFPFQPEGPAIE